MDISIRALANELKINTPDLITRPMGRKIYASTKKKLRNSIEGELIALDFKDIQVIDSSFIDEFLIRLIHDSMAEEGSFFLKLKNISSIIEINIDLVFTSYSTYKNQRIAVITESICRNNSFFIGQLTQDERAIIEFLRVNKSVSLDELVRFFAIRRDVLSSLLHGLYNMRIIRREGGKYLTI